MIKTFWDREQKNSHSQLQLWRRSNPDGLLINVKTSSSGLIHRVECQHLGDTDWKEDLQSLTNLKKVCSLNLRELQEWANENGVLNLQLCSDCNPAVYSELVELEGNKIEGRGEFDPQDISDARQRLITAITVRRGQPDFRKKLMKAYEGKCAVTGCSVREVLEAAHILPYRGSQTNHVQNGLLLRADIHALFDLGLLAIDSNSMFILLSPFLVNSEYANLKGERIRLPRDASCVPSKAALDKHRDRCGL